MGGMFETESLFRRDMSTSEKKKESVGEKGFSPG